jgi:uncharacterized membrane protein YhfC
VGLLTGVTEILLVWLLLRYSRWGRVSWLKAVAFGVGFGAFEAFYLGMGYLLSIITALTTPQAVTEAALDNLKLMSNPLFLLGPLIERLGVTLAHVFTSTLLFYGVVSKQSRWLWLAFVFKSLLDAIAGFAYFWGIQTLSHLWTIEALILGLNLVAWWGLQQVQQRYIRLGKISA